MGQITRTTNPTGLKKIDRMHFVVRTKEDASHGRFFWLESFDYEAAKLHPYALISCIAHAGSSEEYFELGPVSDFNKDLLDIGAMPPDSPLRFRFIFNMPDEALLIGYADGVRALDESGNLGSSLVDIEPISLNGATWRLELPEGGGAGEKPNVLVEKSLFPTAASAVAHPWFGILVMPEVMRQIALAISGSVDSLDDAEHWISSWSGFIDLLGVDRPIDFDADEIAQRAWANEVVAKFTAKGMFKHHMARAAAETEDQS